MPTTKISHGPLTRIVYGYGYGYAVEKFDKDGKFCCMCNHMTHSQACELAFGKWNEGSVVDLTV